MKTLIFTVLFSILAACPAFAEIYNGGIVTSIPNRYALFVLTADTPTPTFKGALEQLRKQAEEAQKSVPCEVVQYAVYAQGKKPGDGVAAIYCFGGIYAPEGEEYIAKSEKEAKILEKIAAYETEAKEIWNAYNDNEFVADEDFKGKPIVFSGKCASVAKDALGKVYVKINIDKHGLHGLQIYLDKNDKFLRQLKRGQDVVFRAYPRSFVMKNVLLDGEVIMINKPKK